MAPRYDWLSLAGFGWLAFRLAAGFLDSWSGLALAWFLDLASGFHLLGFWLDLV